MRNLIALVVLLLSSDTAWAHPHHAAEVGISHGLFHILGVNSHQLWLGLALSHSLDVLLVMVGAFFCRQAIQGGATTSTSASYSALAGILCIAVGTLSFIF